MSSLNLCQFIGRVGKSPEIKTVGTNNVVNFSLGVSEKYTKDGEKVETTEWIPCQVWGKQAETIEKYVDKGDLLYVSGKWKTRTWDKDGVKHYVTELNVNDFRFFPKPKTDNNTSDEQPEYSTGLSVREQIANKKANEPVDDDYDNQLPF